MKVPLFAAAALLGTASAFAQPPQQGWVGAFPHPSILCDTEAQLQSIVDAFSEGRDAGKERYAELFSRLNDKREPTCAITSVLGMARSATDVGIIDFGNGRLYGWMVEVENDAGSGYFLYLESPFEALKDTI